MLNESMKNALYLSALVALIALPALAHNGVPHEAGLPRATIAQIHEAYEATLKYRDFSVAEREGWKKFGGDEPLMGEHWHHPDGPDYVGSDADLDFSRPSNLMYTDIGGKRTLTGVTFNVRLGDGEATPQGFSGNADRWHIHDMLKAIEAALQDRPLLRWLANGWIDANYRNKGDDRGRVAMVHVWVGVPNPDGIFADHNRTVPYLKLGLPASLADGASVESAQGVNLATKNGCAEIIDGRLWIANASKATGKKLHAACKAEAAIVRSQLQSSPAQLNQTAALAWRRFDGAWQAALTPEQHARVDAISEHGDHGSHGTQHQMPDGTVMDGHAHH